MGLGAGRGDPWRPVDQGHFTENSALHHGLNYLAVQQDLDCAGTHHIHLVSLVTFSENHLAGLKADGGRPRISQKLMTDADYFHRCDLLMETQTLSRYSTAIARDLGRGVRKPRPRLSKTKSIAPECLSASTTNKRQPRRR